MNFVSRAAATACRVGVGVANSQNRELIDEVHSISCFTSHALRPQTRTFSSVVAFHSLMSARSAEATPSTRAFILGIAI